MAVYKGKELEEQSIYGSSRLGLVNYASKTGYRSLGGKKYELSNHLGNVLAVVSDNIHLDQDSTWTSLINTTDYYPFGLAMDGRSVQYSAYRYGFNGKELDAGGEWGGQNNYDYGFRIYNPSIAKFLSVDPLTKEYPWYTPYQFAGNTPIQAVDLDGLEELHYVLYKKLDGSITMSKLKEEQIVEKVITGAINLLGYSIPVRTEERVNRYSYVVMHFAFERNTLIPCNTGSKPCGGFFPVAWDTDRNEKYRSLNAALSDQALNDKLDNKILAAKRAGLAQGMSFYGSLAAFSSLRNSVFRRSGNEDKTRTIYRAVGLEEFDDIQNNNSIRPHPGGRSMETKLFSDTFDDAFAQGVGTGKDFRVISVEINESMFERLYKTNTIDEHITQGRNTFGVNPGQVDDFNGNVRSINATDVIKK